LDYQKIDPALAVALHRTYDRKKRSLEVFIYTQQSIGPAEKSFLKDKGVDVPENDYPKAILTARISADSASEISDQPWVKQLKLSQKLHAL
jgi:hypothetical protein